jgi:preprotein translocase subunit SecF
MRIGNIYEHKNYKLLVLIPVVLLFISLYFIPKITLDSSLRGGITITLQTNSTIDTRTLVSAIDSKISGAQASVAKAPGGLSITIASNASIANADAYILKAYSYYGNYTTYTFLVTNIKEQLKSQPTNSTLITMLNSAQVNQTKSLDSFNNNVASEFASLQPILPGASSDKTDVQSMLNSAKDALNNANNKYETYVISNLKSIVPFSVYSYEPVTPTLSSFFLSEMFDIIIVAFVLVGIVVFFIFRTFIPSLAVIFGAAMDILVALGGMGAFGIPMGIASIGGLLMLVGYSIDTDILSAIRILKRSEDTAEHRAISSMKTGLTMTSTAIIVFAILFIVSYISFIPTYFEISGVVLIGLVGDVLTTWFGNAVLILWYKKKKDSGR